MTKSIPSIVVIAIAATLLVASCDTGKTTGPEESAAVVISNIRADSAIGWLYFSLDGDTVVPTEKADTDEWDIRMAYLKCCGQTQQIDVFLNSGTAGPGDARGVLFNSRFESLGSVPSGLTFAEDDTTDGGRIVPKSVLDGPRMFNYDNVNHVIKPTADYVLLVRSNSGNTFKFQFTNIYKDGEQDPDFNTPLGFYHFRYQQAIDGEW